MEIRQLTAADAETYQALRLVALKESPTAFGSSYTEEADRPLDVVAKRFADEYNHVFGAFTRDGELVGMVTLRREPYVKTAHKAAIYAMYVAPALGVRQLNLSVTSTNEAAVALYESCGFERFGLERDAFLIDGVFYDAAYMVVRVREEG